MTVLPLLTMIAVLGQTPVDPAVLAKAQSSLESYLSRVQTLQLTYTEKKLTPIAEEPRDPLARPDLVPIRDSSLLDDHDLLYAFPSLRLKVIERRRDKSGKVVEQERETRYHKGQRIDIDFTHKQYNKITASDPDVAILPIEPLGLRVLHTLNTPISEFLKFPDITAFEGEDDIQGERAIILKIGPKLPLSIRPKGWSDEAFMRVWLASARNFLPLKTEIFRRVKTNPDEEYRLSASDFKSVPDAARGNTVPFPHHLEIAWPGGVMTSWTVQSAVVNPRVSVQDFVMTPPGGYSVAVDGRPQILSGGTTHRDERVRESVEQAKRLLSSLDPPRSAPHGWLSWPIGIVICAVLVLGVVFFLKWRNGS